jgi:hypothetical protein
MKDWRWIERSGRTLNAQPEIPNGRSVSLTEKDTELANQISHERCAEASESAGNRLDELGKRLQAADTHLIVRVKNVGHLRYEHTPSIREVDPKWDELIDEGYDANGSPLGAVYWRVIRRAEEKLYCSSFLATPEEIIRCWGPKGLAYCNSTTGVAVARVETVLPES